MRHRHPGPDDGRQPHPGEHSVKPPHYADNPDDALYDGLPSVTNREWARDSRGTAGSHPSARPHQGAFAESQGSHAQSGQSLGGVAFAGHEHASRVSLGPQGHRGRGPAGYVRPDERIVDDVIDRLTQDAHIDAREILVKVEDGIVTLTGNVPERAMKRLAEDLVANASGVRDVRNMIRVDDGSASAGLPGHAVRSGHDQLGSGFSSSERLDPLFDNAKDSNWPSA
jgi:choline dehydrogenase-like flavoprotein